MLPNHVASEFSTGAPVTIGMPAPNTLASTSPMEDSSPKGRSTLGALQRHAGAITAQPPARIPGLIVQILAKWHSPNSLNSD